ncbi:hypothetical protein LAZ67_20002403 [Cordylochernes scorpioides]|uniref:Uncharacterized protein n=1 Tax=Cordylochernes scorpioides TaxID=51811 RepID=A0ABY6LPL1_9ARAC|nr:hypothetical protein LAZ67_20002403 [Cordylochernes scorpioides]
MINILLCILKDCSSPFEFLLPCRLTRLKVSPSKLLALTWSNPVSRMGNCMLTALELAQEEIFIFWFQKIKLQILCYIRAQLASHLVLAIYTWRVGGVEVVPLGLAGGQLLGDELLTKCQGRVVGIGD